MNILIDDVSVTLLAELNTSGVPGILALMNGRLKHRYTAVYRVRDDVMENVFLIDKKGEVCPDDLKAVPMGSSYCQFVLRDGFMMVTDTRKEASLDNHPYKDVVIAYHAVPLLGSDGEIYGTICHFDFEPQEFPESEYELMKKVARLIPEYCPRA